MISRHYEIERHKRTDVNNCEINIESKGAVAGVDCTDLLNSLVQKLSGKGGVLLIPAGRYLHTGLDLPSNVGVRGVGWCSELYNISNTGKPSITYAGTGDDPLSTSRVTGQMVKDLVLSGNSQSGEGIVIELAGCTDNGTLDRVPSLALIDHVKIINHAESAIRIGNDASFGAGNKFSITNSMLGYNKQGLTILGQSNVVNFTDGVICNNEIDGVHVNHVASTCTLDKNQIMDNGRFGYYGHGVEQPIITNNVFNRNGSGSILITGSTAKYTEAAAINYNLFGDNGGKVTNQREVQLNHCKGSTLFLNYFYGTGQKDMIYLGDEVHDLEITSSHFKDLTSENKLTVKDGAVNVSYEFYQRGLPVQTMP